MNSILSLRGDYNKEGKLIHQAGSEINQGLVTLPLIKSMKLLDGEVREAIWTIVKEKTHEIKDICMVISALDACSAVNDTIELAEVILEKSWSEMDKIVPDSIFKISLHMFGQAIIRKGKREHRLSVPRDI